MSRPPQSREPERPPAQEQTQPPQMREPVPLETIQASVGGTSVTGTQASAAEHAQARFVPNMDFGHYRLLKKLGEGGMGSVWQALHVKLDKHVAVKLLPAAWSRDPALLSRFEREMKAVGKLEHPHIVRAMDAGECEGTHYLVMEFNDGLDLSAYVKQRGPQSVQNACEMVRHAALGLAHAHAAGLIHRDIKPSNLFLTRSGKVKILDLGLARVQGENAGDGQTLTGLGQVLGTPDYMAPEQWENTHAADARSDLYALGCTLFYLLTGRAPFSGEHQMSLVAKMKGHTLDPIPDLPAARRAAIANRPKLANDVVPDEVNAIYRRLMSKRPADRFASANELAEALLPFGKSHGAASVAVGKASDAVNKPSDSPTDATQPLDFFAQLQSEAETQVLPMRGSHATGFTPGGSRASAQRTASDVTVAQKRGNHPGKRGGVMIAGGLVALLLLAGIIIKITRKDGTVTEIEVPDDAKVEIVQGSPDKSKPAQSSKPTANPKSKIENQKSIDPDRAAAEWVLSQKPAGAEYFFAQVSIQLSSHGGEQRIRPGEPLPDEPFQVTQIGLAGAPITDSDLAKFLPKLSSLWRLDITHSAAITDASLPTLRKLTGVKHLSIEGTALSPESCLELAKSLPIEHLGIAPRQATPDVIDFVCTTSRIKSFGLNCSVYKPILGVATDAQIQSLFRAKHLTHLNLFNAKLEMETWHAIPDNFPNLNRLHVDDKSITDAHLAEFARCPKLATLHLPNTSITDAGLPALHGCRTLRQLDVTNTSVTAEGIAGLHAAIPKCRITWTGGVVEPETAITAKHVGSIADRADWPVWAKEIKEPPPLAEWLKGRKELTVKQDGSVMFTTIQAALDKVQPGEVIRVLDKGPYRERLVSVQRPGDFGLVSEVNTVIEQSGWVVNSGDPKTPLGHQFGDAKDVRIHGFTFLTINTDAAGATPLHFWLNPGLCLEHCIVLSPLTKSPDATAPYMSCPISLHGKPNSEDSAWVRHCVLETTLGFGGWGGDVCFVATQNLLLRPNPGGGAINMHTGRANHKLAVFQNVIASKQTGAMQLGGPQDGEDTDRIFVAHNTIHHPVSVTINVLYGLPAREMLIQDNLLPSPSLGTSLSQGAQAFTQSAAEHWRIANNWGGNKPQPHASWLSLTDPAHAGEVPYLSLDPQDRRNYLRLDPAKLPRDVQKVPGALPPGPAPAEGDWFTRLLDRYDAAVQLRDKSKVTP